MSLHPTTPVEIAIVIVTRNVLAGLQRTLGSLETDRDDRIRVYVVDGASSDGTVEYLRQLSSSTVRWISEPDAGIYDAMNKGWRMPPPHAYILYLGAGDKVLSLPSSETLLRARAEGTGIVIGTCVIGDSLFRSTWQAGIHLGNTAHHQALLVLKSLHPEPPFDATLRVYADWEFNIRLFASGQKALFDETFRSYAEPGGVSHHHNMPEVWKVSIRHGGYKVGARALWINLKAEVKAKLMARGLWR